MLTRLKITNFLLIDKLELNFNSGLTVLTGETGSGKSIIVDALMLIFGARSTVEIIRSGENQANFEAEFELTNHEALSWLEANDLVDPDNKNNVIFRRIIYKNNKNKLYINGHSVTNSQVRLIGEIILDIHTQHASITLLKPEMQRSLLDEYAGISNKVLELNKLFKKIKDNEQRLTIILTQARELGLREQIVNEQINELDSLNLKPAEWELLEQQQKQLANATIVLQEIDSALNILNNEDNAIINSIAKLHSRLSKLIDFVPELNEYTSLLDSIETELQELTSGLSKILNTIEEDPNKLTQLEERMEKIFAISRKYRIIPENILATLLALQEEADNLKKNIDSKNIETELAKTRASFDKIAKEVTQVRIKAAKELAIKVTELIRELAIKGDFKVKLTPLKDISSYGLETIEYQVCFNKGVPLQPLAKAASGGELSRSALALYLLLSIHNPPEVIIFDEIDVGIGGKVAAIVGQMLKKLGKLKQVICLTHQPQTASYGDNHLLVSKHEMAENTITQVEEITQEKRVEEIARMLGGLNVTNTTINHARELLGMKIK